MIAAPYRRNAGPFLLALVLEGASLAWTARASAEEATATRLLAAAENAFQEVDFATMHDQATRGIEAGGATRDETARLYVLLGISAAAQARDDEAKRAFIVALALDPTLKLDRTLSPKLREPYLEAQGYWGAYPERLALRARPAGDSEHLAVELVDPGHLAAKIALHVRTLGAETYESFVTGAARTVRFSLPHGAESRGYEYFASALDDRQNVVAELGNEGDPREARPVRADDGAPSAHAEAPMTATRPRSYLLPVALGAAGIAAAGVGIVFQLQREAAAREWNGPGCEHPGESRIQQCADVDSRRRLDEGMAIGAYTVAGLLVAGGVVALVVGRPPSLERQPHSAHAGLIGCGVAGSVVSCAGRF